MSKEHPDNTKAATQEVTLEGVVICPGIGIGHAHRVDTDIVITRRHIGADEVSSEQDRYARAVDVAQEHVEDHIRAIHQDTPEHGAVILEAHKALLRDDEFHKRVHEAIAAGQRNADWVLEKEGARLINDFEELRDPFFRARVEDVRDLVTTIMTVLSQTPRDGDASPPPIKRSEAQVVTTPHLHPSTAMHAQRVHAAGFVTESRVVASHAAILLKGFGMPSVGRVSGLMEQVQEDDTIIVDATSGKVIIRPTPETLERYDNAAAEMEGEARETASVPCRTADGTAIRLSANIGNPAQIRFALQKGLSGVGLFRTEFLIMQAGRIPSEQEQAEIYTEVVRGLGGRPVVIRTFDLGGDKQVQGMAVCTGQNPALGIRGIRRHLLRMKPELEMQMRAILRASAEGPIGIMIPMVTTIEEVREARSILQKSREKLAAEGVPTGERISFGVMIETPAAAFSAGRILKEADFISLGTNDLLQYFMAADRDNEDVVQFNDPESEAFIDLLRMIITTARRIERDADVTICGEIASRPRFVPHLLRLGYRSLSIVPVMADVVRKAIAETDLSG